MNEQRLQAYYQLIQTLLNCPSGEEPEILAVNTELLDADFVQVVAAVAESFAQQEDKNTANWLQNLASHLREALNLDNEVDLPSLSEEDMNVYFQFLMEVLRATRDSAGDTNIIYALLAENTDKIDDVLVEMLYRWGINTLRQAKADVAQFIAEDIIIFSNLVQQFPLGNKASNIEMAITGYKIALTVYVRQAFPEYWAFTQNDLGVAYAQRIKGDKAENLEQAIACLQDALKVRTFDSFPYEWAATKDNLANAYVNRIRGDKAENLEQAIACYQQALKACTFEAFPYEWANKKNGLGVAYYQRTRGDKAENLEQAIACLQDALKVRTFDSFPYEWAATKDNLANAYVNRTRGDKAENLEQAIVCYQQALNVRTFDSFPYEWAATKDNLANAYVNRIRGDKAENLEQAIVCYQQALNVRTFEIFPYDYAVTKNRLGEAYRNRIRVDKAENLEQAIACYQQALKVHTFDTFPYGWAAILNNLGAAYTQRIRGDKAENIEQAIACYQQALKVRTFDTFPYEWARIQMNLAATYIYRVIGDRSENLEHTITYLQQALKFYTFDDFLYEWASVQTSLGAAYAQRIRGNKSENLEWAITCLQQALKVRNFNNFPQDWADTQHNLATTYSNRIKGKQAENLELAITCLQEVLKVDTLDSFPQKHTEALFSLGMVYQKAHQLELAYNTFKSAIANIESLREEIVSGGESKRKQAEHFNEVYSRMVEVCLQLNKITEAIEYAERSKTRNLVEQILERDAKTIFPPDVVTQLETYRDEIAVGQYQIQNGKAENPQDLAKHLQELRQQRNELQNRYLPVGYGFDFNSFQTTLNENTVIIEWYILADKILAFIVTKTREVTVWQSQPEDFKALENWRNQYLRNYYLQKDEWLNSLESALKQLAKILHIDEIIAFINQLSKHCNQIILIPHRFLHLFPLHALPINQSSENSRCLLDLFPGGVSYAPSCQLLQQVQQRKRSDFQSLFAVQNPTGDLNYIDLEVQVIQSYFNTANVLKRTDATLTAINNSDLNTYHCAHFSCHGFFNLTNAGKSALILANSPVADPPTNPDSERYLNLRAGETHDLEKCLTLDTIFRLKLENCRLVTLSACETGLIDFQNTSDEYIGLPSGFLLAGSKAVVSSLWTVSDLSTAFLMMKFYENLQTLNSVSLALNQAQQWLRNLTTEEFEALLVKYDSQIREIFAQLEEDEQIFAEEYLLQTKNRKPYPFKNPFYWAAFTATGV
ncbi:tetratricopeptide repeat protein [Nostoc spongiaeforme FACHB-130]|uniref:Tetratricopeptide repeat protein n=1 Tax=Nostoc spongiaeforme FACHB-130 TaxID=1357510 RepID=A0ABR8G2Z3_9NOSO|nr:CHAT domain-containing protein [Nostoc spongiaeforme]MBD2597539.1 tetratricopeptide repeat protein [Nostoc spongiaeforme FACHB-130]